LQKLEKRVAPSVDASGRGRYKRIDFLEVCRFGARPFAQDLT
jgi:hypothetical protein